MTNIAIPSAAEFLRQLVSLATRAVVLAGCAGFASTVLRVKSTSARLFTWRAVLLAALAMPLLGWMLPTIVIPAPSVLHFASHSSAHRSNQIHSPVVDGNRTNGIASITSDPPASVFRDGAQRRSPEVISAQKPTDSPIDWRALATALYLAVCVLMFVRTAVGLILARRVRRAAREIRDERFAAHLARRARLLGLVSIPHCAESEIITVPVTMGVLHPEVLLPVNWHEWEEATLDAVVVHELSHVARHDMLIQHLSILHRVIFWFSPLAWWLDRHLAGLAEEASDEAALSCGTDSNHYAKTLLGFFETLHTAPGRVRWQGVAMATAGQAERRVERILAWNKSKGVATMGLKKSAVVAIIAFAVPAIFIAASVQPANSKAQETQAPQSTAPPKPSAGEVPTGNPPVPASLSEPTLPPSQRMTVAPAGVAISGKVVSNSGHLFIAPVAPVPPAGAMAAVAPVAPVAPRAAWASQAARSGYSYAYGDDDDDRFVIVTGKTDSLTMSGSNQDAHHVERLRKEIPGDFIWFQRDEKSYIIRDQATIDRARSFWAPQEELGEKQEALGKQQEALGKQQEALGEKMEKVQVQIQDLTPELDQLKAKLKALGSSATQEQLGDIQSKIGDLQSKIGEMQSQAGDQQSKLGEQQSALGEQQSKLGEQQDNLGRQQEEAARQATHKMKELLDEAIKNGKAQSEQTGQGASL
jgi:beta-lactamase regulating signal transducer with metallopeptidase domain